MSITKPQFDALDRLHTIDADTRPIERSDLTTCFGLRNEEAAHTRMERLEVARLVEIIPPDYRGDQYRYRITPHGLHEYQAELARMSPQPAPPALHPDIERATLALMALHAYGTEAAA